jgi:hypothetical protein
LTGIGHIPRIQGLIEGASPVIHLKITAAAFLH